MLLETAAFGVLLGAILMIIGMGEHKRPAFLIAGAIALLITGVLLGADGLSIQAGETIATNYTYANYTGADSNYTYVNETAVATTPVYNTIGGVYAGGWALMLIMSGVAGFFVAFNAFQDTRLIE